MGKNKNPRPKRKVFMSDDRKKELSDRMKKIRAMKEGKNLI